MKRKDGAELAGQRMRLHQRGVSLFVVLVMVLLTTLMTFWAARTALFNELITGNDSDYQRALEAAQAMVRDAELDIQGIRPDGQPCGATTGFTNCRPAPVATNIDLATKKVYFPPVREDGSLEHLTTLLAGTTPSCVAAICTATNLAPQFWTTTAGLSAMRQVGARYGEFTGANPMTSATTGLGNPLLISSSAADARAFYWVEPLPFARNGSNASLAYSPTGGPASATATGIVYRITAVVQGMRPGTQAVIQTIFVRKEASGA